MGFSHEKVETKVEKLSGGEKVRLLLGLMAMDKPHILILDEPTSHLDIDSREALIYALNDFPGAVLLITHDVYLAEATADQLWLVKDGKATNYDGDLRDYRALVMQADRTKDAGPKKDKPAKVIADVPRSQDAVLKAALPLKRKADAAEKALEKATAKMTEVDEALIAAANAPGAICSRNRPAMTVGLLKTAA